MSAGTDLTTPDEEVAARLREHIRRSINLGGEISDAELLTAVESGVDSWSGSRQLTSSGRLRLVRQLYHSFRGLDVLQPLLEDDSITEIMINGHERLFVERAGRIEPLQDRFESRDRLEDLIQAIVAGVNRAVNESSPIVDARLADGSRVHIVLPPASLSGPIVTIRKFPKRPLLMEQLIAIGCLTEEASAFLGDLVKAGYNIFISGGTGSGKTTFLNALSRSIPADERVVTIEDSAELQLNIPNLVRLETRNANTEGKGELPMRQLIRASLRMRPNRVIVGEVRGAEAADMLAAMNTGHDGSMSSGHSNSAKDMLSRLETMVLGAADIPIAAIRQQISSAVDIIVHLSRMRDHSRKVLEISQLIGISEGEIGLEPLFVFGEEGGGRGSLKRTGAQLQRQDKWLRAGNAQSWGGESLCE
ncbi:CpaF family protein [Paenibacillus herberti]|uniref:Pilus assembly protein n=1 Tax=Paenibacillus herberti TaxID=1619309 RepID=A0A229P625_9BACL|nr:CpaF family protein [Paenibacillus herberti]OXM17299.1 pilus assembly protein [Paenibacillus herberti]